MTAESTDARSTPLAASDPADASEPDRHTTTVRLVPNRKIEGFGLDEVWAYRELIIGLLHRDLMAIRNQTPTAWFWRILAPAFPTSS
jgi:hypothetical protein